MRIVLFLMTVLIFATGRFASAQDASRSDVLLGIEECRAVSVEFMRAACLEAAEQLLKEIDESSAPDDILPSIQPAVPVVASPFESENPEISAARDLLAKERAEIEQARAALEEQAKEVSQKRAETERMSLLARLGLVSNPETEKKEIAATITIMRATKNRQNIYTFYTRAGDAIRQDPDALRMRPPSEFPATARLERRLLGSKWLTFTENPGRSYKVKVLNQRAD